MALVSRIIFPTFIEMSNLFKLKLGISVLFFFLVLMLCCGLLIKLCMTVHLLSSNEKMHIKLLHHVAIVS